MRTRSAIVRSFVLVAALLASSAGCGTAGGDADTGLDNGGDTDADADADADTDTVPDAGADGGTDAGTDAGADAGGPSVAYFADCDGGRYASWIGLCWQDPKAPETYFWQEAVDYCAGLDLAGHDDWVLPGFDDFVVLLGGCPDDLTVDSHGGGYCDPCDDSWTCGPLFGSDSSPYWSSTLYNTEATWLDAWFAYFANGMVARISISNNFSVRCVRTEAD